MEETILRLAGRPEPFEPGDAGLWTDPRVARGLLAAHLDPDSDEASRRPERIEREVERLAALAPAGARVLDLGCGPGLYANRLAARGFAVTGVDVSATALAYARTSACALGFDVEYRQADYRELDERESYDLALLVYLDLGVLSPPDRRRVLGAVRRALRPGGAFAFDVCAAAAARPESLEWRAVPGGGFWRERPHLVLERRLDYPELLVSCREVAVLEPDGGSTLYRIWEQRFRRDGLERELREAGFSVAEVAADLAGGPWTPDAETIAVVARREG